jgi:hypothetical protein
MFRIATLTRWSVLGLLTVAGLCWMTPGAARAENALRQELKLLARDVKQTLDKEQARTVAVGEFTARSRLATNAGPGIRKVLAEELKGLGVILDEKAPFEIQGYYQDAEGPPPEKEYGVRLAARLLSQNGDTLLDFAPRMIYGEESRSTLLAETGKYSPNGDREQRSDELKQHLLRPDVDIQKVRIRATPDSPYAIEIHVKKGSQYGARAAQKINGKAFVPMRAEEVFAVVLINDSDYEAAATLALDGLSVFAFSQNKNYTYWFVPAHSKIRIDGWHLNNRKMAEFIVRNLPDYEDGSIRLRDRSNLGVITACFSAAWVNKDQPPRDEYGRNGTFVDKGKEIDRPSVEVSRYVGKVRAAISVRYQK